MNPNGWLVVGVILIFSEMIIPGGIVIFLGASCLIIAALIWLGLVTTWVTALTLFFIISLALIILLRSVVARFAGGDYSEGNTVEILDDVGQLVEILETIGPGNKVGRIQYRGSQWDALGDGEEIGPGDQARIVALDNVRYIVEKVLKPE